MNDKDMFLENNIKTLDNLFQLMQHEISYGWIDQRGNRHNGVNDAKTYSLQSPKELLKSKLGICWDMTELARSFFKNMTNLEFETYYLFYDDNCGCPSHSILVFYKDNKAYWFEPMFQDKIYEYSNIEKLLRDFKIKFIENGLIQNYFPEDYNKKMFYLYRYEQPNYHINGNEMRAHIDHSLFININNDL